MGIRVGDLVAARYRVDDLLGSGPSGIVLAAKHILFRTDVTLKILASYTDSQTELVDKRVAKARRAARLRGPHVARVVDIGLTDDAMPYVASERLAGVTLEEEMQSRGRLPYHEAVRWVLEACEGLAEAHAFGLVHGDLKPQNLFLAEPSKKARASHARDANAPADDRVLKILDFGSTSPLEAIGDQSASAFFGSPAFLAPEQIQDADLVDARADVWALGALLFHLTMGHPPFRADTLSGVLVAVVYDAPSLLTEAPWELAKIVAQCLEKDPANRPRDVAELARRIAPFAGRFGKKLAARVAEVLDAPPASDREPALADVTASGSMPPVSVDTAPARPTPQQRAQRTQRARRLPPSLRHRQMERSHVAAFASLGVAAAVALAGAIGAPEPMPAMAETELPSLAASRAEAVIPPFVPPTDEAPPAPEEPADLAEKPMPATMSIPTPVVPLQGWTPAPRPAPPAPAPPPPAVLGRRRDDAYFRKLFGERK